MYSTCISRVAFEGKRDVLNVQNYMYNTKSEVISRESTSFLGMKGKPPVISSNKILM